MATSLLSSIILMAFSINLCMADPRTDFIARICGNVDVQNISNYFQSYSKVTDCMQDDMYRNKFAFKDVGKPPDRIYALSQCMDDLSPEECAICFTQITTIITGCIPHTGGRVYLDGCFFRAENYSFYREALSPQDTTRCSAALNPTPDFRKAVVKVLDEMIMTAPFAGPVGRGFAVKHEISQGVTAYGMASCWKILDKDLCYTCLSNAASSALSCLPSTEARVLNTGCFLRYADFSFANESTSEIREKIFSFITFVICVVTICLSAIGIGVCVGKHTYKRKNSKKKLKGMEDLLLDEGLPFLQFKYETIKKATENFEEVRRLGEGGFGEVYKGALGDGREIAIKRLYASKESQIREICNEVDIISRAQHKNVVRLLGCCFTSADSFLVYEYMANRSLDLMLFDPAKKNELTWKKRLLIITGTAEGLEYLHTDCQVRIIHRDIKASNILLDLKHKPKISDFGLARFYSCDQSLFNTAIAGTLGYMAPEYIAKGRLTEKFDVYSFGILVIEIVTGIENNKHQSEDAYETLIAHVWRCFQSNTISEIVDKNMEIEDMNEIERVIQIGLLCAQESPNSRPTMTKVVQMLRKKDLELPQPSMPPFIDEHMELHCLGSERCQQRRSFSDYLSN